MTDAPPSRLHRGLGLGGATVVGLSAMLGTGVFSVWTPAWLLAGSLLLASLTAAALVAMLNAISTARLARVHPESGGAYAYGRRRLNRGAGVLAGVAFVLGKSASAAAAALTIGAYAWPDHDRLVAWVAILVALAIDLRGIVRSTRFNAVLVALLIAIVVVAVGAGATNLPPSSASAPAPSSSPLLALAAAGMLFVAFAGYARITVLGEEVREPARTIPRAMLISFVVVAVLYAAVGVVVAVAGARGVPLTAASLASLVGLAGSPVLDALVRIGAVIGAGSVLITLLAGMGRTVFAMAEGGDAPRSLAAVSSRRVPHRAAVAAAVLAAVLVAFGRIGWALALSGSAILVYYSVAHLAAMTLPGRVLLRRVVPIVGLVGCLLVVGSVIVVVVTGQVPLAAR